MKKIEAVVRPAKLGEIKAGLDACGIRGMTVSDVLGCGQQKGYTRVQRGRPYSINLLPKVKIELVVSDDAVTQAVELIAQYGRTGDVGDGKVFVYPVEEAFRIRTGERGDLAL